MPVQQMGGAPLADVQDNQRIAQGGESPAIGMVAGPILQTERLDMRWLTLDDGPQLRAICDNQAVAATSGSVAHPYPEDEEIRFVRKVAEGTEKGTWYCFGLVVRETGVLIGDVSLHLNEERFAAEIGYLLGEPYWGKGYASEAAAAALRFSFETLGLRRIEGRCVTTHPASARIMEKIGMTREGRLKDSFLKWGVFFDDYIYGITRDQWQAQQAGA